MAKRTKKASSGASNAYLLSFGDTMTTLLAFFIVLNSLAEEQTGANLYQGTGSFVRALDGFGLAGNLPGERRRNPVPAESTTPNYLDNDPDNPSPMDKNPVGPDEKDNDVRVIDREAENFERFLNEMGRLADVQALPATRGETVFDFFNRLQAQPPYLNDAYREALTPILPLLYQPDYRVEIIVWAATPSTSAWARAVTQAMAIRTQILGMAQLDAIQRKRLQARAQPWIDPQARRPVLSFVVRRVDP